jgi:hypothetical protein
MKQSVRNRLALHHAEGKTSFSIRVKGFAVQMCIHMGDHEQCRYGMFNIDLLLLLLLWVLHLIGVARAEAIHLHSL